MGAWAELVNSDGSDEHLELCERAMKEIQEETARKHASKQRAAIGRMSRREPVAAWRLVDKLPDLIDPDVTA
jgi:hypothetical protein